MCTTAEIEAKQCFSKVDHFQLFDLTSDPYELHNIYNQTDPAIQDALAKELRKWYPCVGPACP